MHDTLYLRGSPHCIVIACGALVKPAQGLYVAYGSQTKGGTGAPSVFSSTDAVVQYRPASA
ncbi:hypothetical protein BaRGS_00035116, partial [Batillaria attramentaria]